MIPATLDGHLLVSGALFALGLLGVLLRRSANGLGLQVHIVP